MKRVGGYFLLVLGSWSLIAPQANLGLTELRWLSWHTFPGEAIVGMFLLGVAYYFLGHPPRGTFSIESSSGNKTAA